MLLKMIDGSSRCFVVPWSYAMYRAYSNEMISFLTKLIEDTFLKLMEPKGQPNRRISLSIFSVSDNMHICLNTSEEV